MSIRIDGSRIPGDPEVTRRLEAAKQAEQTTAAAAGAGAAGASDRVEVSADAQLVASAIQAVHDSPDVRPEAVARGRQILAAGKLGLDPVRLADRIIDALLKG
jgi:flagellar biosynthesis anti-sigma factor FlgM